MTLYFITGNKNKFAEISSIIPNLEQMDINLPEIQDVDAKKIIKAKLLNALKYKKFDIIVEDTSLYFDSLNGLPGPLIKWFIKKLGNEGLVNLVKKLGNNKAEAKTIIGYAKSFNEIYFFEGSIKGEIIFPKGDCGFGWDCIFQPNGYSKSFAQLTQKEKNEISMRGIAINKLKKFIENKN